MMAVDRQQWVLALYDASQHLVARTPRPRPGLGEAIGVPSGDPLLARWREGGSTTLRGAGLGEDKPQIWGVQRVEGLPLFTVAGFSEARALAQWRRDLRVNLVVAALLLCGCTAILLLYHRNQKAQVELRESESYFRALFNASPEAIAVVACDGHETAELIDANARYRNLFGLSEVDRTLPWEMAPQQQPDGRSSRERGRELCRQSHAHTLQRVPWVFRRPDASSFDAEMSLFAFRHNQSDVVITVIRDLTELRAMEEKLHQSQKLDALGQLAEGGRMTISTRIVTIDEGHCDLGAFRLDSGDFLHISFSDTGHGISESDLQKIFEPFFTTKEVDRGTGLGLAAVFGTMASHRGAVTVSSRVGEGTTFHLYLPLAGSDSLAKADEPAAVPMGRGRLLVIDDEDLVRTTITMQLEALGYTPLSVGDPHHAAEAFQECHGQLIGVLLDLVMPGISGRDLAIQLNRIDPTVPIILMSGFPRNAQISSLMGGCVAGFIQKPFNRQELAELLSDTCRNRRDKA